MLTGRLFPIPERPSDVAVLWRRAEPLQGARLPEWLDPGLADTYRYVGSASTAALSPDDVVAFRDEVGRLELAGLVVDAEATEAQRGPDCW